MSVFEVGGGRVTHKSLMNKTKSDLAFQLLTVLDKFDDICKVNDRLLKLQEDIETTIADFAVARDVHWNAVPDDEADTLEVYDDILRRLREVYKKSLADEN